MHGSGVKSFGFLVLLLRLEVGLGEQALALGLSLHIGGSSGVTFGGGDRRRGISLRLVIFQLGAVHVRVLPEAILHTPMELVSMDVISAKINLDSTYLNFSMHSMPLGSSSEYTKQENAALNSSPQGPWAMPPRHGQSQLISPVSGLNAADSGGSSESIPIWGFTSTAAGSGATASGAGTSAFG